MTNVPSLRVNISNKSGFAGGACVYLSFDENFYKVYDLETKYIDLDEDYEKACYQAKELRKYPKLVESYLDVEFLKSIAVRRPETNHNCSDPNCPHKMPISPMAILAATKHTGSAERWTPLDYPIISLPKDMSLTNAYNILNICGPNDVYRVMYKMMCTPDKLVSYFGNFIEAIVFDNIPDSITIWFNDYYQKTFYPKNKYLPLFIPCKDFSPYTQISIKMDSKKEFEINIIAHVFCHESHVVFNGTQAIVEGPDFKISCHDGQLFWLD